MDKLAQGAEAIITSDGSTVTKHRFEKSYRHPSLDKSIRRFRTRRESKVISRLAEHRINAPELSEMDDQEMKITMSHLHGPLLKEVIEEDPATYGRRLGILLGRLHGADIIHGDLTTSNVVVCSGELYLIDFGLSSFSIKVEDKAVEWRVMKRALESKHPDHHAEIFTCAIEGYLCSYPEGEKVISRFTDAVSKRGRNQK